MASGTRLEGSVDLEKLTADEEYKIAVLRLPQDVTEDGLDTQLASQAQELGINTLPVFQPPSMHDVTASLSTTTLGSTTNVVKSVPLPLPSPSPRSVPKSVSPNGQRPVSRPTHTARSSQSQSDTPSILSVDENQSLRYGLRASLRKMKGFKKRKTSIDTRPSPLASIDSNIAAASSINSIHTGSKSPMSVKSYNTSSSSPSTSTFEEKVEVDDENAVKRTANSPQMQSLRKLQSEEKARFLDFRRSCIEKLGAEHQNAAQVMREQHAIAAAEMEEKNQLSADDLESRQLEAEAAFREELEAEKRACLIRLRHMEAYCHTPSYASKSVSSPSSRPNGRPEKPLPERKVTDRDYHNLAAQYRQRDAMDTLHKAKIDVMQGRQEKAYNEFVKKKEKELTSLIARHLKEETDYGDRCEKEMDRLNRSFASRAARLQSRWKLQSLVQTSRLLQETGLTHAPPSELSIDGS